MNLTDNGISPFRTKLKSLWLTNHLLLLLAVCFFFSYFLQHCDSENGADKWYIIYYVLVVSHNIILSVIQPPNNYYHFFLLFYACNIHQRSGVTIHMKNMPCLAVAGCCSAYTSHTLNGGTKRQQCANIQIKPIIIMECATCDVAHQPSLNCNSSMLCNATPNTAKRIWHRRRGKGKSVEYRSDFGIYAAARLHIFVSHALTMYCIFIHNSHAKCNSQIGWKLNTSENWQNHYAHTDGSQ